MDQRCVPPAARLELELTRFGGHLEAISGGVRYEKYRPAYPPEFRRQMVDLVHSGQTPEELSEEFEPTAQSIAKWVRQADRDAGRRADGTTSAERQELSKLRNENRRQRQERDILAMHVPDMDPGAAAWFAWESKAKKRPSKLWLRK